MKKNLLLALMSLFIFASCGKNDDVKPIPKPGPIADDETHWMVLSTEKAEGDTISLAITAEEADKANVWIDLNGNSKKDEGESVISFGSPKEYIINSKKIVVYGKITKFICNGNKLTNLDVSNNTALESLNFYDNNISTLDLSKNMALKELTCTDNKLGNLDLSKNNALEVINCINNELTSINISGAKALKSLFIYGNNITDANEMQSIVNNLPVYAESGMAVLKVVIAQVSKENKISENQVDIARTKGWKVQDSQSVEYLGEDDVPSDAYKLTFTTTKEVGKQISIGIDAAGVHQANVWIDLNGNGTRDEGEDVTFIGNGVMPKKGKYTLGSQTITVYGRITYFQSDNNELNALDVSNSTALKKLKCTGDTLLTSLDVSKNMALEELWFSKTSLATLSVSSTALHRLECSDNSLTSLDVSKSTALTRLDCKNNSLTTLDVSNNLALKMLFCDANQLTALAISNNKTLERFTCSSNLLSTLDISNNKTLERLNCSSNPLSTLDISNNTALSWLNCSSNGLSTLAVGNNTALSWLDCRDNFLEALDISKNIDLRTLYIYNNKIKDKQNMQHIVDNLPDRPANAKGTFRVVETKDSKENKITTTQVKLAKAKNWKVLAGWDDYAGEEDDSSNPIEEKTHWIKLSKTIAEGNIIKLAIMAAEADQANVWIDLNGNGKKDEGEAVSDFKTYPTTDYTITSDVVTVYGKITELTCNDSKVTSVDVNNDVLKGLNCAFNEITSINISGAKALNFLAIQDNKITDVHEMQKILDNLPIIPTSVHSRGTFNVVRKADSKENKITKDQVKIAKDKNWAVRYTIQGGGDYEGEEETHFMILGTEKAEGGTITLMINTPVEDQAGVWIDLNGNGIKEDEEAVAEFGTPKEYIIKSKTVVVHGKIASLICKNNELTALDVSNNRALKNLFCQENKISTLDLSKNTVLKVLFCNENKLSTLDLSNNNRLEHLNCIRNEITSINIRGTKDLNNLNIFGNNIKDEKEMQSIIDNLPDRSSTTGGQFRVVETQTSKENKISKAQVGVVTEKGWAVKDSEWNPYAGE